MRIGNGKSVAGDRVAGLAGACVLVIFTALTGCQNNPPEPKSELTVNTKTEPGVPGYTTVATHTVTANITHIDKDQRLLTLALPEGRVQTVRCGREIVNFDQLRVGEQVKAVVTEEVAVAMADPNTTPQVGGSSTVSLAPKGGAPGGVLAETRVVTATVTAIDQKNRHATLTFPDGTTHVVAVRDDVDLSKRKVGEKVVIRTTQKMALSVEKP
jgi:uncharacterized OB-fold protein